MLIASILTSISSLDFSASATRYITSAPCSVSFKTPLENHRTITMYGYHGWISSPTHPNGDIVAAYYIVGYVNSNDAAYVAEINSITDSNYGNAKRLATASPFYNCHSYAWYSQDTSTNRYWVNDPSALYTNEGYTVTTSPQIGDIICYMQGGENIHSGIIVAFSNGSSTDLGANFIVESKWGPHGAYRHNGYQCPYTSYNGSSYSNVTLKFYTRTGHTHSHSTITDTGNDLYHECKCSCGQIIHAQHRWIRHYSSTNGQISPLYLSQYYCADCGAFTTQPIVPGI